jgi:prepilin peptidase CpaA
MNWIEAMNEFSAVGELLMMLLTDPRTGVLIVALVVAAIVDLRSYRIPNWLTAGGMIFGLLYNTVWPTSPDGGLLWSLEGLVTGLLLMLPLYLFRVMGAGDVKLMAMVGAFVGMSGIFYAMLWTFIVGGIVAIGYAYFQRALKRMMSNVRDVTQTAFITTFSGMRPNLQVDMQASAGKMPYGVSIAIGTIGWMVARQLGYL